MKAILGVLFVWVLLTSAYGLSVSDQLQASIKWFYSIDYRFFDLKPLMKE